MADSNFLSAHLTPEILLDDLIGYCLTGVRRVEAQKAEGAEGRVLKIKEIRERKAAEG